MRWLWMLCALLTLGGSLVNAVPFKKQVLLGPSQNWIPLGRFTLGDHPQVRASILTEFKPEAVETAELLIYSYTHEAWQEMLKSPNCTGRLIVRTDEYKVKVPLSGAWAAQVPLKRSEPTLYLVAADCYNHYSTRFSSTSTEIEVFDAIVSEPVGVPPYPVDSNPIPQSSNATTPTNTTENQTAPVNTTTANETQPAKTEDITVVEPKEKPTQESHKFESSGLYSYTTGIGMEYPVLGGAMVLLLCLLMSQVPFGALCKREFAFSFLVLLFVIVGRLIYHGLLIVEAHMPSKELSFSARIVETVCHFSFLFHCILILCAWPPGNCPLIVSNSLMFGVIYTLLWLDFGFMVSAALRCALLLLMLMCFFLGRHAAVFESSRLVSVIITTLILALIYLSGYVLREFTQDCSYRIAYWTLYGNALFQDMIMGLALVLPAFWSRQQQSSYRLLEALGCLLLHIGKRAH